jgi:hypothetical protein
MKQRVRRRWGAEMGQLGLRAPCQLFCSAEGRRGDWPWNTLVEVEF